VPEGGLVVGKRERDLFESDDEFAEPDGYQMSLFRSNKYSLENACEVCDGLIRHEPWCIVHNNTVFKAFEAVLYGLDEADEARLAGMGVRWTGVKKGKTCK